MAEHSYDFESLDEGWLRAKPGVKWNHCAPRLAAWVADMDFRPAPEIMAHLHSILEGGDLGYPDRKATGKSRAVEAFVARMHDKYAWSIATPEVREWNDVVQSLQAYLNVICMPGDRVVVHTPAYPPFFSAIEQAGCSLISVPARVHGDLVEFDHDELDTQLAATPARVLLLCNPHNPTGHVFSQEELVRLVEIAERHDLVIISDEIHSDIVYDGRVHCPIATIPGAAGRTVTLNSASKSFNIAGLHYALSHCGVPWVEERLAAMPDHFFGGEANVMGAEAAWVAWTMGDEWFEAVLNHLRKMRDTTLTLVQSHLPGVTMHTPNATYLAWLDCSATPIANDPYQAFRDVGVEVSDGVLFGPGGHSHVRLNFATSTIMLGAIVTSMSRAI